MKCLPISVLLLIALLFTLPLGAASIDTVASSISPASTFNGNSGNFTVTDPVLAGGSISFTLTFSIDTQGGTTTYPRTIGFGSTSAPAGATVSAIAGCTFTSASSTCADPVTITAPTTPGAYTVTIIANSGTGGRNGLSSGGGITISFTVANPPTPTINRIPTHLTVATSVGSKCLVLHAQTLDLSATLTPLTPDLFGKTIDFTVKNTGGVVVGSGSASVQSNGVATTTFNSGLLPVGDYTVEAHFDGATVGNNEYLPTNGDAGFGVAYLVSGFQQPINADGSSVFNGKVVPVKIKIGDYMNQPVVDAAANVFFAKITTTLIGTVIETSADSIANTADGGNTMRYDPLANQYVFNWDTSALGTGTYGIRVGLGEGVCSDPHIVQLSLGKKK